MNYFVHFKEFKKKFENPILKGQDSLSTSGERAKAAECLSILTQMVNQCLIRRTSQLLTKYLPVKFEHVICVKMTPLQTDLYKSFLSSEKVKQTVHSK